jgi:pilus assembly protein CpaC
MKAQSLPDRRRAWRAARGGVVAGLLLALGAAPAGWAGDGALPASGPAADVQFTVTEAPAAQQMVSVPVNQGVLVDFNMAVSEVRVANAAIADATPMSPKQILVNGKSYGTTQLIVVLDGGARRVFTVAVDLDLARLQNSINQAVPRAKVRASGILDTVVISGLVPDPESAERIMQIAGIYSKQVINQMTVAGVQQVLLRCTVAEVNRTATRQLGFNGWMGGSGLPDMFAVNQLYGINPANIGAAKGYRVGGENAPAIPFGTDSQNGLPLGTKPTLSLGFPGVQMQIFIQALRENGLLRVLAEPNLVTISGQEATFLAGGEFPVPVPQRDSVTIEFREFGVRLNFTPTVLGQDVIRLRVAPEVSEPDYTNAVTITGYVIPGLTQRRVETVVELGPGQTFAIGGLLSEKTRAVSGKVPGLGDLPVLGALFSSQDYKASETELVVLVTPELVAPLNPDQVTYVPGAKHIAPNDWELFGLGKLDGEGGGKPAQPEPRAGAQQSAAPSAAPATGARLRGPIGPAGANEGV